MSGEGCLWLIAASTCRGMGASGSLLRLIPRIDVVVHYLMGIFVVVGYLELPPELFDFDEHVVSSLMGLHFFCSLLR